MNRTGWLLHQNHNIFSTFDAEQWQPKITADYFITAQHIRASFLQRKFLSTPIVSSVLKNKSWRLKIRASAYLR